MKRQPEDEVIRVRMQVYGHVCGYGLRSKICQRAEEIGIAGWIQNAPNLLSVTMEVQGTGTQKEELLEYMKNVPGVVIKRIETEMVQVDPDDHGFGIIR